MSKGLLLTGIAIASLLTSLACTKAEPPAPGPSPSGATSPVATVTASAVPSASASPELAVSGSPSNTAVIAAAAAATAPARSSSAATATSASSATAKVECGTKSLGQPDCPLQAWMKSNMNPPVMTSDTAALAIALEKSVALAPAGYTNWASIAKDGAKAAKSGDLAAAKQSCRGCHDQYKKKYQAEIRSRKI